MLSVSSLISGAQGLLGKETTKILLKLGARSRDMHLITAKPIEIKIDGKTFTTNNFSTINERTSPELYFDFAFMPKNRIDTLGKANYIKKNQVIMKNSSDLITKLKPKSVILTSSGAVYKSTKKVVLNNLEIYSTLKKEQEEVISNACDKSGSKLIIVRIFNLSGSGIYSKKELALSEFIKNALFNKKIEVNSDFRVYRRYCDIGQLIRLLISLGLTGEKRVLDTGGVIIELRKLATEVKIITNSKSELEFKEINTDKPDDLYFSNSTTYENLVLSYLNETPHNLKKQLLNTINDFKVNLDKNLN